MSFRKLSEITFESLNEFLPNALPREFELSSSSSTYFAIFENGNFLVMTNRGEFVFSLYELIDLLMDVELIGSLRPSKYDKRHNLISYKLPIIVWLLHLVDSPILDMRTAKVSTANNSNIESKSYDELKIMMVSKSIDRLVIRRNSYNAYDPNFDGQVEKIMKNEFISSDLMGHDLSDEGFEPSYENRIVSVFYSTTRKETNDEKLFGSQKAYEMSYGRANLSIPLNHESGVVERPPFYAKSLKLFNIVIENSDKHIVLQETEKLNEASFTSEITKGDSSLIFIHGYNVNFKDALYQSAQLKFDLAYNGDFILYSWPSFGSLAGYLGDKERAASAGEDLARLIEKVAQHQDKKVYILAHSMGSYCLSNALKHLNGSSISSKLRIALAAPDVDSEDFEHNFAKDYLDNSNGVSIYACMYDRALTASKFFNKSNRLGRPNPITVIDGMDTIDTTPLLNKFKNKVLLNHSYVFNHNYIVSDLFSYFFDNKGADSRRLKPKVNTKSKKYWEFHPC